MDNSNLPPTSWELSTRTGGHEIDHRAIGTLKYIHTGNIANLKNQVENHSKIENSINNQNSITTNSNLSKDWKEKRNNMLYIMIQTSLF